MDLIIARANAKLIREMGLDVLALALEFASKSPDPAIRAAAMAFLAERR